MKSLRKCLENVAETGGQLICPASYIWRNVALVLLPAASAGLMTAAEISRGPVYSVIELELAGPALGPDDTPARDIDLQVRFQHEHGAAEHTVHGFWDGDGQGGSNGGVFKVRFTPTREGRWKLLEVHSNHSKLDGQHEGDHVRSSKSEHSGFWIVDDESPGRRWYRRSDGSHPFIFGNTHYSFLSKYGPEGEPIGNDIAEDIAGNARYFRKLRFALHGDRYPDPKVKPYFDDNGNPTDSGDHSHRPNPGWFHRADLAVGSAYQHDLIADLILAGPDTESSRSTLKARGNNGDPEPYLKYVGARYGSYPNVWICLANEFEIKNPKYSEEEIARFGRIIRRYLPYPTALSVHSHPRTLWPDPFDDLPGWADHMIIQNKIRKLAPAADVVQEARRKADGTERNMPVVNDELSYEGKGDQHSEKDTIESHLGIFLGGGYGTTGEKPGNKLGQYFRGKFDPSGHRSADNLKWLREQIESDVTFWKMEPGLSIFSNLDDSFRGLVWPGQDYVLGTNKAREGMVANLPEGTWRVTCYDVISKKRQILAEEAEGRFKFDSPESRAAFFNFKRLKRSEKVK